MEAQGHSRQGGLAEFVDGLQAAGRYTFDRDEAMAALGISSLMLKKAVMRLAAKGRLVAPKRGFYVVVPIEYRSAGAPPPSWFIDDLFRHLGKGYYVGVLSAAALHGAAHQQPQEFQVVTKLAARRMVAGRARIRLLGKRQHERTATMAFKTPAGSMRVSTPEATAIDLLRYPSAAGGLGNVATVLAELSECLDAGRLAEAAEDGGELAPAQRLGFLLELVGENQRAEALADLVARKHPRNTLLRPGRPPSGCLIDRRWRVVINEEVESDV